MPITEHTINDALAAQLRQTRQAWRDLDVVRSENTGMLKGSAGRPDILVVEPNVSPVCIETEVLPAVTVEREAIDRLGRILKSNGRQLLSSISVRMPATLTSRGGAVLDQALADTDQLEIAMFTGASKTSFQRWPPTGWIKGGIADLSVLTQYASVPPEIIEQAADQLVAGVSEAAGLMQETASTNAGAIHKISEELLQADGEQTRRMAATILVNAFVFHGSLAGGTGELGNVKSTDELRNAEGALSKASVLAEWRKILQLNYWAIFDVARRILEAIPTSHGKTLIEGLAATADKLLENRLMRSHDLTGQVFQKLIADRKFLAAYYTTPSSAALLAGLVITQERPLVGSSWANPEDLRQARIADFACGTGTLLSAAYQRVGQLHELAGGNAEALHPSMMANVMVGCDVLPAAAHLTASMLSGAHPTVTFDDSNILTVKFGRKDGELHLGSLNLLDEQGRIDTVAITAKALKGKGEGQKDTWRNLPHNSFDCILMNPPFTRDTGQEAKKKGVPNPMFAAFAASKEDQREMSKLLRTLTKGSSAHGNAGEGSIFLVLANRKLKVGGSLGLVLPLSLLLGDAWAPSRNLLGKTYTDLILVSIAGAADDESSFSADTAIAECLVIGRKSKHPKNRATFVILDERPASPMLGMVAARHIAQAAASGNLKRLEDGPVGGTPIYFGDTRIGQIVDAPINQASPWSTARPWNVCRIADVSLGQSAYQLSERSLIWLPGMPKSKTTPVKVRRLAELKPKIGPYHADINGNVSGGGVRGPFDIVPIRAGSVPTYPALWAHETAMQRSMKFDADSEAIPKKRAKADVQASIDAKVIKVWSHAAHCHFNRDFRFNSQSTGMQFTPRRALGGRAWIAIRLSTVALEKTLVLWANTTLGLLLHWWHANKQQSGRGGIGVSPLDSLPTLDITQLSAPDLAKATKIFDDLCDDDMQPIHEIDRDATRRDLDERFGREILGLPKAIFEDGGTFDLLRQKLAAEPSIRGNKAAAEDEHDYSDDEEDASDDGA